MLFWWGKAFLSQRLTVRDDKIRNPLFCNANKMVQVRVLVAQLCLTLGDPWTVAHQAALSIRFPQTRILEWAAIPFSRESFWTRDQNPGLLHYRQTLYCLSHQGSSLMDAKILRRKVFLRDTVLILWQQQTERGMSLHSDLSGGTLYYQTS